MNGQEAYEAVMAGKGAVTRGSDIKSLTIKLVDGRLLDGYDLEEDGRTFHKACDKEKPWDDDDGWEFLEKEKPSGMAEVYEVAKTK